MFEDRYELASCYDDNNEKFQDPNTENATMAHRYTRDHAMEENYMISSTTSHLRTFNVHIFFTRETQARIYAPVEEIPRS